jgi:hypothetical protein
MFRSGMAMKHRNTRFRTRDPRASNRGIFATRPQSLLVGARGTLRDPNTNTPGPPPTSPGGQGCVAQAWRVMARSFRHVTEAP